jgi:hypothetical protein
MAKLNCANCGSPIPHGNLHLNDDHSDNNFCDSQCFKEWAEDEGFEAVIDFYKRMNCGKVIY